MDLVWLLLVVVVVLAAVLVVAIVQYRLDERRHDVEFRKMQLRMNRYDKKRREGEPDA